MAPKSVNSSSVSLYPDLNAGSELQSREPARNEPQLDMVATVATTLYLSNFK